MGDQAVQETDPTQRYIRFKKVLGRGSFKTVYAAFDTHDALEVAWNKLHVDRLNTEERARVMNEVRLLGRLDHKNIIRLYDSFPCSDPDSEEQSSIAFITEQMMSGTLKEYLKKAQNVKLKVIRKWCYNILDAIAYLHGKRIMHRDLKLDNLFMNGHVGEVKIGDLGLSSVRDNEKAESVIGTPEFMAPELYEESYTEKVDIYAFGMCLLEMVTMEDPYSECKGPAQIMKKVVSNEKPDSFRTLIECDTKEVIASCLEPEAYRPSAGELLQHPLFRDWEKDDGTQSNKDLIKIVFREEEKANPPSGAANACGIQPTIEFSEQLNRDAFVEAREANAGNQGADSDPQLSVQARQEGAEVFRLSLQWPIADGLKSVSFACNPGDRAQDLAKEMVTTFDLDPSQLSALTREIEHQVHLLQVYREREQQTLARSPRVAQVVANAASSSATASRSKRTSTGPLKGPETLSGSRLPDRERSSVRSPQRMAAPDPQKSTNQSTYSDTGYRSPVPSRPASVPPQALSPSRRNDSQPDDWQPTVLDARGYASAIESASGPYYYPTGTEGQRTASHIRERRRVHSPPMSPPRDLASISGAHSSEPHLGAGDIQAPVSRVARHENHQSQFTTPDEYLRDVAQPQTTSVNHPSGHSQSSRNSAVHGQTSSNNVSHAHATQSLGSPDGQLHSSSGSSQRPVPTAQTSFETHEREDYLDSRGHPMTRTLESGSEVGKGLDAPGSHGQLDAVSKGRDASEHQRRVDTSSRGDGRPERRSTFPVDVRRTDSNLAQTSVETGNLAFNSRGTSERSHDLRGDSTPYAHALEHAEAEVQAIAHVRGNPVATGYSGPGSVSSGTESRGGNPPGRRDSDGQTQIYVPELRQESSKEVYRETPRDRPVSSNDRQDHVSSFTRENGPEINPDQVPHVEKHEAVSKPAVRVVAGGDGDAGAPALGHSQRNVPIDPLHGPLAAELLAGAALQSYTSPSNASDTSTTFAAKVPVTKPPTQQRPAGSVRPIVIVGGDRTGNRATGVHDVPGAHAKHAVRPITSLDNGSGTDVARTAGASETAAVTTPTIRELSGSSGPASMSVANGPVYGDGRGQAPLSKTPVSAPSLATTNLEEGDYRGAADRSQGRVLSSEPTLPPSLGHVHQSRSDDGHLDYSGSLSGPREVRNTEGYRNARGNSPSEPRSHSSGSQAVVSSAGPVPSSSPPTLGLRSSSLRSVLSDDTAVASSEVASPANAPTAPLAPVPPVEVASDPNWSSLNNDLMYSASSGNAKLILEKLSAGASVQFSDYDHRTPLHLAAAVGSTSAVEILLEAGADVNAQDRWGGAPIRDAQRGQHLDVVQRLVRAGAVMDDARSDKDVENKACVELLHFAATGNLAAVKERVLGGAQVNYRDYDARTALHLACSHGHADVADFLLFNGADPLAKDRVGRTPGDNAWRNGHRNVVEVLRQQISSLTLNASLGGLRVASPPSTAGSGDLPPQPSTSQAWQQADGNLVNGNGNGGSFSSRPRSSPSPNPDQLDRLKTEMAISHSMSMGNIGIESDLYAAAPSGSAGGASTKSLPLTPYEANPDDVDEEHALLLLEYEREKSRLDAEHRARLEGLRRKKTSSSSRGTGDSGSVSGPSVSPPTGSLGATGETWARSVSTSSYTTPLSGTPGLVSGTASPAIPPGSRSPGEAASGPGGACMSTVSHPSQLSHLALNVNSIARPSQPAMASPPLPTLFDDVSIPDGHAIEVRVPEYDNESGGDLPSAAGGLPSGSTEEELPQRSYFPVQDDVMHPRWNDDQRRLEGTSISSAIVDDLVDESSQSL